MKINLIATNHDIQREKNHFVVAVVLFSVFILKFVLLPTQLAISMHIENSFVA